MFECLLLKYKCFTRNQWELYKDWPEAAVVFAEGCYNCNWFYFDSLQLTLFMRVLKGQSYEFHIKANVTFNEMLNNFGHRCWTFLCGQLLLYSLWLNTKCYQQITDECIILPCVRWRGRRKKSVPRRLNDLMLYWQLLTKEMCFRNMLKRRTFSTMSNLLMFNYMSRKVSKKIERKKMNNIFFKQVVFTFFM